MKITYSFPKSILILLVMGMLFSCENDLDEISQIDVPEDAPNEILEDLTLVFTDSGRVKVKLEASYVEKFGGDDPLTVFSDGLKLIFLDREGKPMSELTAEYGEIRERENKMVAKHNVVFENQEDGKKLETEELIWEQDTEWRKKPGKVYTNQPVAFTSEKGVIYGQSLITNESFDNPVITTSTGTIYYSDSTKTTSNEQEQQLQENE